MSKEGNIVRNLIIVMFCIFVISTAAHVVVNSQEPAVVGEHTQAVFLDDGIMLVVEDGATEQEVISTLRTARAQKEAKEQ